MKLTFIETTSKEEVERYLRPGASSYIMMTGIRVKKSKDGKYSAYRNDWTVFYDLMINPIIKSLKKLGKALKLATDIKTS